MGRNIFTNTHTWLLLLGMAGLANATPISLESISAGYIDPGYYQGGTAQLLVDGVDYSPNLRGFNLVVINQNDGTILQQANFDTYASYSASEAMATFINSIETGRVVMSAVKDEGSNQMTYDAVNALYTLGVGSYPLSFRSSWAFIGVKGGAPGSAIEASAYQGYGPSIVTSSIEAVPEPASLLLFGTGLLGLGGINIRNRKRNSARCS